MDKKYEYKKKDIPKDIVEKAERLMHLIGCRTFTAFVTIALTEYMNKLENKKE